MILIMYQLCTDLVYQQAHLADLLRLRWSLLPDSLAALVLCRVCREWLTLTCSCDSMSKPNGWTHNILMQLVRSNSQIACQCQHNTSPHPGHNHVTVLNDRELQHSHVRLALRFGTKCCAVVTGDVMLT